MVESRPARRPLRRTALGPVAVTAVLAGLTATSATGLLVSTTPSLVGGGWVLAWLLLGLTAGYALSGSA